ncbi:MAG: TonB-dependent receptor [Gammaproteobacteria bacterium]|jgi:iron complex outermembrane receptor protein|nr:TonB-dependent receptor [Gammaproteobacteria bacterium]
MHLSVRCAVRRAITRATLASATGALLASAATLAPAPARAQGAAEPVIEEVTVTARRREESLQDVPIAVSSFSGAALETIGAEDLTYLSQETPNVTLENSRATNSTLTAFIRGVGQQDPVAGFEQGVGIYLDDVYLNRPQAAILDVYDVERIEVLRGPQGTLYGRNTIGGAVKYVTRRLDADQATLKARVSLGSYSQVDGVLSGSVPVSDTFRVGGAVASFNRDGFGENRTTGDENYDKKLLALRASLEWQPVESLTVRLSGDYTDDDSAPRQGYRLLPTVSTAQQTLLGDDFDTTSGVTLTMPLKDNSVLAKGGLLNVEWSPSEAWTFKSVTAYREDESESPIDFDSTPARSFDALVVYTNEQTSQEFQLIHTRDRLTIVGGAYYLDANAYNVFDVVFNTVTQLTVGDVDTKTWAVFGEATFDLSEQWSLTIGGRYTDDERRSRVIRDNFLGVNSPFFGNAAAVSITVPVVVGGVQVVPQFIGSRTDTDFTPRAIVAWQPNGDLNLYASYSEGFKGGGFDPRGNFANADVRQGFLPETVESYELGAKARFLDGRATVNTAVFFMDYADVQIPGSLVIPGPPVSFVGTVTNAGAAEMKGVELESAFQLTDALSAKFSFGYIDAEYTEFLVNGIDISAQRDVQNTPDWTGNVSLSYGVPLASGRLGFTASASYRGATQQFEIPIPLLDQAAYWLYDASVTWSSDDERWQLGLHGRNLSDERYVTSGYNFPGAATDNSVLAFYGNPRTVTLTATYRFD